MGEYGEFSCLGNSETYDGSLDFILKTTPDVIFINLNERMNFSDSPIQLIRELYQYLDCSPILIAISDSRDKAYEAIKLGCSDYLLTPLTDLELRKSLFMIKKKVKNTSADKICLRSYSDYQFLDLNEILFLKADGNTTDFIMLERKKIPAFKSIKNFESILPRNFLRVHKSYIINTDFLLRINFAKSRLTLIEEHVIPFSRAHKSKLAMLKETFFNLEAV